MMKSLCLECQQADWNAHKKFCKAYFKLPQSDLGQLETLSDEPINNTEMLCARAHEMVVNKCDILGLILNRALDNSERTLVATEPRCLAWYVAAATLHLLDRS